MTMYSGEPTKAGDLAEKAVDDMGKLMKAEIGVAKAEMQKQAFRLAPGTVALGGAGVLGLMGLQAVVFSAGFARPLRALFTGIGLMGVAGALGFVGFRALPESSREALKSAVREGVRAARVAPQT